MKHDWATSESRCLGQFRSTRGTIYQRMVFWFVVEGLVLAGFIYMALIEPSAPVGSPLRSVVAGAMPTLCLLWTATMTLLVINGLRLFRPCEFIWVYPEGFAVKSTRGDLRRAYTWREIASITGDTSHRHSVALTFSIPVALASTGLLFLVPIAIELGFTG